MRLKTTLTLALLIVVTSVVGATKYPTHLYEEWRKSIYPAEGITATTNPTALLWASENYWNKKDVTYNVYLSQDKEFAKGKTFSSLAQRYCFFNPHEKLAEGVWYWKYEVVEDGKVTSSAQSSFVVDAATGGVATPTSAQFVDAIYKGHPRVLNYGRSLSDIQRDAPSHPLYKRIINDAISLLDEQIYEGAVGDKTNAAEDRRLKQLGKKEVDRYNKLLQGYVLSNDKRIMGVILARTEALLNFPTDDLLGSNVLNSLAMGFDLLYDELPNATKERILRAIDNQFKEGLKKWVGRVEGRHVENHFWQMEIAGNFRAALATLHHLESAKEMLCYTYELFIARFPNLATPEGGWAEGEGYYSVNKSAAVDMALLMSTIGGVNIFDMEWYRNFPDYMTYFAPINSPLSGYGDMHDRAANGNTKGVSEMMVLAVESGDEQAKWRLFRSLNPKVDFNDSKSKEYIKKLMNVEPWYQIVNDIKLKPTDVKVPTTMAHDKVMYGVGLAAMHEDVLRADESTAVYFRSSPFGAKGHMHANQNAFNISRRGERIFYSTGYYTSFADPHALTSYRHTRAHNAILINGCGQAYGHEGYGFITRHIEGEQISYVSGDATPAYKATTDEQFIKLHEDNNVAMTQENGLGDESMERAIRHVAYVRPDIVVIYDVLESKEPATWSLLLHTVSPSSLSSKGELIFESEKNQARANVYSAGKLASSLTDEFFSPAIDFKKKYKGVPNQYHATFESEKKSSSMRFLTIIRLSDGDATPAAVKSLGKGRWSVDGVVVEAELDGTKAAKATISTAKSSLTITDEESAIREANGDVVKAEEMTPIGNYAF